MVVTSSNYYPLTISYGLHISKHSDLFRIYSFEIILCHVPNPLYFIFMYSSDNVKV